MRQTLTGWGRYPVVACDVYRAERRRDIGQILACLDGRSVIPRGLGRSYGDTAVNENNAVLDVTRLDRMIAFDPATGVLECEAGVSLAAILEHLVPRGWFPAVVPGTKFVTVGGAIANDVHGKNHHRDGTFCQFVDEITLLTPAGEVLTCSKDVQSDLFWATAGGIGLTGIVLSARIRLRQIASAWYTVDYRRCGNLDAALAAMDEGDDRYAYSVAWVDCLARGVSLGRSILMRGNHARPEDLSPAQREHPLRQPRKRAKNVPMDFPCFALNSMSVKAFNEVFFRSHPTSEGKVVDYDSYFFPLDAIHHWNRIYGKRGFVQYQATVPLDSARNLGRLLERLTASDGASFLAVLKRFGAANPGLLSHPFPGYTLTLDLPVRGGLLDLLGELDRIVLDCGGRLYCAKDAAASRDAFAQMYPKLDAFRAIKAKVDPDGVLSSNMARRLGIVER